MPIYYKGNWTPWYILGYDSSKTINIDPRRFKPEDLPGNEIRQGNGAPNIVRIPRIPGRICERSDGYIELIISRSYDKEKGQSRNKKVIIGSDCSQILPGMMTANDHYYEYFNSHGRLVNDPMKDERKPPEQADPTEQEQPQQPLQSGQQPQQAQQTQPAPTNRAAQQAQTAPKDNDAEQKRMEGILTQLNEDIKAKQRDLAILNDKINRARNELEQLEEKIEDQKEELAFAPIEAQKEHIRLLSYMLDHFMETIKVQANRKPNAPMTLKQVQTINGVLAELKEFFTGSEAEDYLRLAEEPDEATNTPGITNGEMALLLGIYHHTASTYLYGDLSKKLKKS